MKLLNRKRNTGKSTQLVYASEITRCPIVVSTISHKEYIKYLAKELGCNIPEPINTLDPSSLKGRKDVENGVLIDDAEYFIGNALKTCFPCPVIAATISYEDKYDV